MYPMEHTWTRIMHKTLQTHLLCAFFANLKIDAIYALYPESFCDKTLLFGKFSLFVTLLTINISRLASVVIARLRKAGRGVDGEVNFFSKLEEEYLRC